MGCWNGTCMVSRLPILSNEKVKLVILYNSSAHYMKKYRSSNILNKSGFCNIGDILSPAFLPITGGYDEIGAIEDDGDEIKEDFNTKIIFNTLKERFTSKIKVEGKEIVDWTLNDIIRGIERGNSYGCSQYWNERTSEWLDFDLSSVLIREDVYNDIITQMKKIKVWDWKSGGEANLKKILTKRFNNEVEHIKKMIDLDEKRKSLSSEEIIENFKSEYFSLLMCDDRIFRKGTGETSFMNGVAYERYLYDNINNKKIRDNIFKQWSEYNYIQYFLDGSRLSWMIQAGKGSQDTNWKYNKFLSKIIIDVCDKKIEEEKGY